MGLSCCLDMGPGEEAAWRATSRCLASSTVQTVVPGAKKGRVEETLWVSGCRGGGESLDFSFPSPLPLAFYSPAWNLSLQHR